MADVPSRLGPFEPLHRLGAGGMAETFVAVRRGPGGFEQRVCIKRILPAYASDREFVRSFLAEARTSAALRHANIVQVLDFGISEDEGSHYLALELVDGLDLRALLQRGGRLDPELTILIASELAAALAHAHSADEGRAPVVHRDISPSNVLISRAGEVKLTDFGIARALGGPARTATGVLKGKLPYMPPEYLTSGEFEPCGDLFSLGVLLFELLEGERPFEGSSELDTMRRIVTGQARPLSSGVPRELAGCIERLLETIPSQRIESASALLDALPTVSVPQVRKRLAERVRAHAPRPLPVSRPLEAHAGTLPAPRRLVTRTRKGPSSSATRGPSRRALGALSLALALALAVLSFALLRRQPKTDARASSPASGQLVRPAVAPALATPPAPPPAAKTSESSPPSAPLAQAPDAAVAAQPAPRPARPKNAELRLVVYPYGDLWLDDKFLGQSPLTVRLTPGTHTIAVGEGRARERRTIHVAPGSREHMVFQLPRVPAPTSSLASP